jgi:antitoxin ChpS
MSELSDEWDDQVAEPTRTRPTLDDLLDLCDPTAPWSDDEIEWFNDGPVGNEVI